MRLLRLVALGLAIASLSTVVGCAGETEDEESGAADEAISSQVLQPKFCNVTAPNRSKVPGVYDALLTGCLVARGNETGAQMMERAIAIVTNPAQIGSATHPNGTKMFKSFRPSAVQGSLNAGGIAYDSRVGLDIVGPIDAGGTIRFSAQRTAAGGLTLTIVNTTSVGAIGINPLEPRGMQFTVTLTPAQNGIVVSGAVKVTFVSQKDSVDGVSWLAPEIVGWLKGKLGAQ